MIEIWGKMRCEAGYAAELKKYLCVANLKDVSAYNLKFHPAHMCSLFALAWATNFNTLGWLISWSTRVAYLYMCLCMSACANRPQI